MIEEVEKYTTDILDGTIPAGVHLKNAVARFINDYKRSGGGEDDANSWEFREDAVIKVVNFVKKLKHFKGETSKKNFVLEPWQLFIVANLYGFYNKDGSRRFQTAYIEVARKNGKALALHTPIPTPDGYKTMGGLSVGDTILGADGKETKVTFVTPIQYFRKCYKVTFEDGEEIIADAEHLWQVKVKTKHEDDIKVLRTEDLLDYALVRADGKGVEYRYRVPMPTPIDFRKKELFIDPYILGLWLGDGNSAKPAFTVHEDDLCIYDYVMMQYGNYKIYSDKRNPKTLSISFAGDKGKDNSKLRHDLIRAGVFRNKHIPVAYLRSSIEDRISLLQGLMDTDGYVDKAGQCEFSQHKEALIDQVCELIGSLGIKYVKSYKASVDAFVIRFFTDKTFPCFRIGRKYDRLKSNLNGRMLYKSITSIERTESVRVRCITVDNEDGLYLCGRHYTVTHNTALVAALALYHLVADGEDGGEILFSANSLDQAKIAFAMVDGFALGYDPDEQKIRHRYKDIFYDKTSSFIKVLASDSNKLDGYNCSLGVVDEYHSAPDSKVRDVLRSSMGMRKNPMLITITTAGFNKNLPCYELRQVCADILTGDKIDDSFFGVIFSLDETDDWKDANLWVKANPNMNVTVKQSFINQQVLQAVNSPADEVGVKTKNLNMWCDSATVWIPEEFIQAASQKLNFDDFKDEECYVGVDLASNVDLTAVSYMFYRNEKYYFFLDYYVPVDTLYSRVHADISYYKDWVHHKYLKTTPGNVTDYDYITRDMLEASLKADIIDVYYDKYNATSWATRSEEQGLNLTPFVQTIGNFNNCTKEYERLMLSGDICLDDNPITRYCLRNVELRSDFNGNVKPNKESDKKKIDGVIAMLHSLAAWLEHNKSYHGTQIF